MSGRFGAGRRLGHLEDRFFRTVFFGSATVLVGVWLGGSASVASPAAAVTTFDGASVDRPASNAAGLGATLMLVVGPRIQAVFVLTTSTLILRSRILLRWLA